MEKLKDGDVVKAVKGRKKMTITKINKNGIECTWAPKFKGEYSGYFKKRIYQPKDLIFIND